MAEADKTRRRYVTGEAHDTVYGREPGQKGGVWDYIRPVLARPALRLSQECGTKIYELVEVDPGDVR